MQLQHVDNRTPFEWFAFEKMGPGMRIHDVLIVKGACQFVLGQGGFWEIVPAEVGDEIPIHMSDEAHDFDNNPYSSLRVAGDTVFYKPATDFVLRGHAVPIPGHEEMWPVEIAIHSHGTDRLQRMVLYGERSWRWGALRGGHLGKPSPCENIELRYELAYGGSYLKADQSIRHDPNPVGRGFLPTHRMDREVFYPAARMELANDRLSAVDKPIGVPALGPIARTWASRKRYAGTYSAAWREELKKNQHADYAPNFDLHFFQAAHPHWIFEPHWRGDETISLKGLSSDKGIVGRLPGWQPVFLGHGAEKLDEPRAMLLDTVEVDLDRKRLYLTWRITIDQSLQIEGATVYLKT